MAETPSELLTRWKADGTLDRVLGPGLRNALLDAGVQSSEWQLFTQVVLLLPEWDDARARTWFATQAKSLLVLLDEDDLILELDSASGEYWHTGEAQDLLTVLDGFAGS